MTSTEIKAILLRRLMQDHGYLSVVTEGLNGSDVCALTHDFYWVEYEVKTARSDLREELQALLGRLTAKNARKLAKHDAYLSRHTTLEYPHRPRAFYFVVPEELVNYAAGLLLDLPYGIYGIEGRALRLVRPSYFLNALSLDSTGLREFLRRAGWEVATLTEML